MNTKSPLIPEGSLLEQKNKGRARVKLAVFFVLAIHGVGLMALLMQGCRRDDPAAQTEATNTIAAPTFDPTNAIVDTTTLPVPTNVPTMTDIPSTAPAGTTEHAVAKNENFSTIGKKYHVTARAIADANPGIDPVKLKIGQKLHIPPPAPAPVTAAGIATASAPESAPAGEHAYTVKSGDTLIRIARNFGTTPKAIRAVNSLKTDSIKVGQKLKIPGKAAAPVESASAAPGPMALSR